MARLDAFIDRLFTENGTELTFATGAGANVVTAEGPVPLLRQPLSMAQLVGAVREILPEELQETFPSEGVTLFGYGGTAGRVSIRFDKLQESVQLRVVPDPAGDIGPPMASSVNGVEIRLASDPAAENLTPVVDAAVEEAAQAAVRPASSETPQPPEPPPEPPPPPKPPAAKLTPAVAPRTEWVQPDAKRVLELTGEMGRILIMMVAANASDVHMSSGCPPMFRVDGRIRQVPGLRELTSDELQELLFSIAPEKNRDEWMAIHDTDFALETADARFRVNLYSDRNGIGAVLRQIPHRILTTEELGLTQPILDLCALHKGLVVVTGPTGSGKSTTLAAMVDHVNRMRDEHIITIEDPIEFVHPNKRCLINQREVGVNTTSFKHALRAALREDPNVVLVGEMRDLETVSIAIETAETGHLVFGTLHTSTAASTVDRIIDQFPSERQAQIRTMLSESLKGVIAQTLCRKIGGGRVAALEVLLCSNAVSNLIREGKTYQITSVMQINRGAGMITLNDSLLELVKKKIVDPDEAYARAISKVELKTNLEKAGFKVSEPEKLGEAPGAARQPLRPPPPAPPSATAGPKAAVPLGKMGPQDGRPLKLTRT